MLAAVGFKTLTWQSQAAHLKHVNQYGRRRLLQLRLLLLLLRQRRLLRLRLRLRQWWLMFLLPLPLVIVVILMLLIAASLEHQWPNILAFVALSPPAAKQDWKSVLAMQLFAFLLVSKCGGQIASLRANLSNCTMVIPLKHLVLPKQPPPPPNITPTNLVSCNSCAAMTSSTMLQHRVKIPG
jgi:hypothetical protein